MAEQIEVFSFDVQTKQAQQQVRALLQEFKALQAQQQQLQKAGKDTAAIDARIAQAKEKLNRVTQQETKTEAGTAAKRRAAQKALKELNGTIDETTRKTDNLSKANARGATSFAKSLSGAKGFSSVLARGTAGLASFAGAFGLQGVAVGAVAGIFDKVTTSVIEYFTATEELTQEQQRFRDATDSAILSIGEETRASNTLFEELRSGEATEARRIEIIKLLNDQYPEVIGNTNLLTASEEELQRIQKAVNDGIRTRILLETKGKQEAEIFAKIAQEQVAIEARAAEIAKNTAETRAANFRIQEAQSGDLQRIEKDRTDALILSSKRRDQLTSDEIKRLKELEIVENDQKARAEQANADGRAAALREDAQIQAAQAKIESLRNELAGLGIAYQEVDKILANYDFGANEINAASNNAQANAKAAQANAKAQTELSGSLADLRAEASRLNRELEAQTKLNNIDRIEELGAKIASTNARIKEGEELIKEVTQVNAPYGRSINEINKALSETQRLLNEQTEAGNFQEVRRYTEEIIKLKKEIEDFEKLVKFFSEPLPVPPPPPLSEGVQQSIQAAKAQIAGARLEIGDLSLQRNKDLLKLQEDENKAIVAVGENEKKREEVRKQFADRRKLLEVQTQQQILQNRINAAQGELALSEASGEAELEQLQEQRSEIIELQRQLAELQGQEYEINIEVNSKKTQKSFKETLTQVADLTQQLSEQVIDFVSSRNQAAIATADAAISRQEDILNKLLENEETANVEQVRLEQERLDKLNQERERAKEREGAIAQAQIAINLALAVARAVAEGGGFASAATVAIALSTAIFGFLKAKQASTQAFAEGTMHVKRGKGEPKGKDTVHAMVDEGESIFSKETTKKYQPALQAIFDGEIPAETINGFVNGEHVSDYSQAPNKKAVKLSQRLSSEQQTAKYIVVQSDVSTEAIAAEIRKMPKQYIKGGEIYTVVKSQTSKVEKQRNRAKGY